MVEMNQDGLSQRPADTPQAHLQQELALHLETLRDLGPEYAEPVARALVGELDQLIDEKVRQGLEANRAATLRDAWFEQVERAKRRHDLALHLEAMRRLGAEPAEQPEPVVRTLVGELDGLIAEKTRQALELRGERRPSMLREKQRFVLTIFAGGLPMLVVGAVASGSWGVTLVVVTLLVLSLVVITHDF